tara:strand:+ start:21830 stop:22201 length:372 start_codon:yes stop_codon:yes gene_type:complete
MDLSKRKISRLIQKHKVNFNFSSNNDCLEVEEEVVSFFEELDKSSLKDSEKIYTMDLHVSSKDSGIKTQWEINSNDSYRNYEISVNYCNEAKDYIKQFEQDTVNSLRRMLQGDLEPKNDIKKG